MAYSTLKHGASGEDVKTLQKLLNSAGFALEEDGVFGDTTRQAVTEYQSANRLPADGVAGAETWAKLAANVVPSMPKNAGTRESVKYLEQNAPAAYASGFTEQLDALMDQILNRESFSYDPAQDDLYKRYRDEYRYLGERAMNDARGSAAGLSGGYLNSYAESAGQQAYQHSMAQLADAIPDLYALALSAYDAETGRLNGAYSTLSGAEKEAYSRYQDDLDRYAEALKYYYQKLQDEQKQEAKKGSSGGAAAKETPAQATLPNILTRDEFDRRKRAGSSSLTGYKTYEDYYAAMKKKYA